MQRNESYVTYDRPPGYGIGSMFLHWRHIARLDIWSIWYVSHIRQWSC